MADHYGCVILPARRAKPRDKGTVENGVLISKRWILAVLRKRTFCSLAELNTAIRECLERLNNNPMRKLKQSRREVFETTDRSAALPQKPYEYAEWGQARVGFNYHIEIDHHYYSVPYQLLHEKLDIRVTTTIVGAFNKDGRVAAHTRSYVRGEYTTLMEHIPPEHRFYAEWSPERFIRWAGKIGPVTARVVGRILDSGAYPPQALKSCMGILHLERDYKRDRIEAAAKRALKFNTCSYRSIKSTLSSGLDQRMNITE